VFEIAKALNIAPKELFDFWENFFHFFVGDVVDDHGFVVTFYLINTTVLVEPSRPGV
jgi:hypothetical protein